MSGYEMTAVDALRHLYWLHLDAARKEDEPRRERLFKLVDEFEWACPDIAAKFRDSMQQKEG